MKRLDAFTFVVYLHCCEMSIRILLAICKVDLIASLATLLPQEIISIVENYAQKPVELKGTPTGFRDKAIKDRQKG